jgi:hypothetical protein
MAYALTGLAVSSYRAKAVKIGNACVWALANMPIREGIAQLQMLGDEISNTSAQKKIAKVFEAAANR